MSKTNDTVDFLSKYISSDSGKILDVCCNDGLVVRALSNRFPKSHVYGLDINSHALVQGIKDGNFDNAIPIHGDAYELVKDYPRLSLVHLDPQSGSEKKPKYKRLEGRRPLKDFDVVMTSNPVEILSRDEVNQLMTGEQVIGKGPVPISVIQEPAKMGGTVIYSTEIANSFASLYNGPSVVTKGLVAETLDSRIKEAEKSNLSFIDHTLLEESNEEFHYRTTDLATLFRKKQVL